MRCHVQGGSVPQVAACLLLGFGSLITLLLLSSGPAYAEWVAVSVSEGLGVYAAYFDPDTIRRKGDMVTMWSLLDFKTIQKTEAGDSLLSLKGQSEYNCAEERDRTLAVTLYSGNMGNGNVVFSSAGEGKCEPVVPGGVGQILWKFACGKK